MPPRIAIPLPTSNDHDYNRLNWPAFAQCVSDVGGIPVEFALDLDDHALAQLAHTCHAVLLPGSPADVDPATYGHPRDPATAPPDPRREHTDRFLIEHAGHFGKPLLGVCFGAQMLNVCHGGTLVQDLALVPVNHAAARTVLAAHTASVAVGSLLYSLTTQAEAPETNGIRRLPVNSSHHQAIAQPGQGLRVTARCPQDAIIEAIEREEELGEGARFLLGVQWHPERTTAISHTSRALFQRLIQAAGQQTAVD